MKHKRTAFSTAYSIQESDSKKPPFGGGNEPGMLRRRLCMVYAQIVQRGVTDFRVLDALRTVARHLFVSVGERDLAYDDGPLSLGFGQTASQLYMIAVMTEALQLSANDKVLEVGTGSGYQATILALLARELYSIEWIPELAGAAATRLSRLGLRNVTVLCRDGSVELLEETPFDAIMVTAAAPHPPASA